MIEAGVVIDKEGKPLFWHLPPGRSGGSIPDTRSLWDVLWENRDNLSGFAHSHPGGGIPGPSETDVSTFRAVEQALGKKLDWWITSSDAVVRVRWYEGSGQYQCVTPVETPKWVEELRKLSRTEATCKHQWWNPDDDGKYACMHCGKPQSEEERHDAMKAALENALEAYVRGEFTVGETVNRILDESGWIPPKGTVRVRSVCGTPEFEETEALLHRIRVQCDKGQFWNALALTRDLMGVLMQRFDAVLKGRT